ncbi:MAG: hypothetical protein HY381_00435 [Candidatus Chisholmbacteria bacterium]|nr:hypothetical protein [Candidatus Chisholmbacteria bacterium]
MSVQKIWLRLSPGQRFSLLAGTIFLLALPIAVLSLRQEKLITSRAKLTPPFIRPPSATNLVVNPSFEIDTNNDLIPDYWNWSKAKPSQNSQLDCKVAQEGQCSFLIKGNNQPQALTQSIELPSQFNSPNSIFTFQVWTKTQNAKSDRNTNLFQAEVTFFDTSGKQVSTQVIPLPVGTHDFKLTEFKIPTPSSISKITLTLRYNNPGGQVWFDNLSLTTSVPLSTSGP